MRDIMRWITGSPRPCPHLATFTRSIRSTRRLRKPRAPDRADSFSRRATSRSTWREPRTRCTGFATTRCTWDATRRRPDRAAPIWINGPLVTAGLRGRLARHPVLDVFLDTVDHRAIPHEYPLELIEGRADGYGSRPLRQFFAIAGALPSCGRDGQPDDGARDRVSGSGARLHGRISASRSS